MTCLEHKKERLELPAETEIVVGGGAQATWRVRNADLMPRHFVVCADPEGGGGGAILRPFSSEAVVSVNGRQLSAKSCTLHDGDLIGAGSSRFYFWSEEPKSHDPLLEPLQATAHLIEAGRRTVHPLDRRSTGLGQDSSNALVVRHLDSSHFHAEIRREAGGHALRTMGASPVTLNGQRVAAPALLSEGDEIGIGGLTLRYTLEPPPPDFTIAARDAVDDTYGAPQRDSWRASLRSDRTAEDFAVLPARTPLRYLAVVSSVIAAVAIATLLLLHRTP